MTIHGLKRVAFSYLHDVSMAALSFLLALYLRLGSELFIWPRDAVLNGLAIFTLVAAAVFLWMRLHRTIWRYASVGDLGRIVQAVVLTVVTSIVAHGLSAAPLAARYGRAARRMGASPAEHHPVIEHPGRR